MTVYFLGWLLGGDFPGDERMFPWLVIKVAILGVRGYFLGWLLCGENPRGEGLVLG